MAALQEHGYRRAALEEKKGGKIFAHCRQSKKKAGANPGRK
jgi:hypothetical protein